MGQFFVPLALALGGIIAVLITYRGIRRGGARYYTLEREAMLRRATYTLFGSMVLFLAAVAFLIFQQSAQNPALPPDGEQAVEGGVALTATATPFLEQFPPTPSATPDVPVETLTPTPVVCRAVVEGTSGNGLTLRDTPGGNEITVLPDGSVLTVLEDEPTESGGFTWRKVRIVGGEEGWVAEQFLTIRAPCN